MKPGETAFQLITAIFIVVDIQAVLILRGMGNATEDVEEGGIHGSMSELRRDLRSFQCTDHAALTTEIRTWRKFRFDTTTQLRLSRTKSELGFLTLPK